MKSNPLSARLALAYSRRKLPGWHWEPPYNWFHADRMGRWLIRRHIRAARLLS